MPNNILPFALAFERQYAGAIDPTSVFATISERDAYLSNATRYAGQQVTCVETPGIIYIVNAARDGYDTAGGGGASAHAHTIADVTGLVTELSGLDGRLDAVEDALTDLPPPANYMLELDTAPTYASGRIKIIKYKYVSDAAKKYEERFSYDTNGRISYIQLKDDVSGKWIQRSYGFTTGGELLLPTVITISAWTIV